MKQLINEGLGDHPTLPVFPNHMEANFWTGITDKDNISRANRIMGTLF